MAARKSTKSPDRPGPDRFHVGQKCYFVLDRQTGHEYHNGKPTTVLAAREWGEWTCSDDARPERGTTKDSGWRYTVLHPDGLTRWHVTQEMLRAAYDGEKLSTWEKFAKKTGVDPRQSVAAGPRKRIST